MTVHVLIAGFQHETNTFASTRADWEAFVRGGQFPPYRHGPAVVECFAGVNIPVGGFIDAARDWGWTLLPSAWAGATPSAHVTEEAFERLAAVIVGDVLRERDVGRLDAVYLDLHGAAVSEHLDDPEGELLARIRCAAGPAVPIVASLDLHANVTDRMLDAADALVAYRTYPHIDLGDTGRRAASLLRRRLQRGARERTHAIRIPYLIPVSMQSTTMEPAASVYRLLEELDAEHEVVASFAMGFPSADIEECGPVVWAHGDAAAEVVCTLYERINTPRTQWRMSPLMAPAASVAAALEIADGASRPVVIADIQDNPGAGGDSNTTGMLHALVSAGAGHRFPGRVALGLMVDPPAAAAAHAAGAGAELTLELGRSVRTFSGEKSEPPLHGRFKVRALHDGRVTLRGPVGTGLRLEQGPSACLEYEGVLIAVASEKMQLLDREQLRALGIAPERMKLLVNKSSAHFRADFEPIAERVLLAKAAGPMAADPGDLPWTKLRRSTAHRP